MPEGLLELLRMDGVVRSDAARLTPLQGGVSSEIFRVEDRGEVFAVKRALAKLKVRDEWTADLSRNVFEQRYLAYAARILPGCVPALRAAPEGHGYFAMEYLGSGFRNWKEMLLEGEFSTTHARSAARILGCIHRASAGDAQAAALFDSGPNFYQLRIEPYLLTTGGRYPDLAACFQAEAERLAGTRECLVHGDFSPKNILIGRSRTVILDCEAAYYGDPAFDVCFLLNHLLLKSLFHGCGAGLTDMTSAFWSEYSEAGGMAIEPRVPRLLLMLLLARVDGKSPVEYLNEPRRQFVRQFVCAHLPHPPQDLAALTESWFGELGAFSFR